MYSIRILSCGVVYIRMETQIINSLRMTFIFMSFAPSVCFTSFLFGDSLVDAGNNNYLFTISKADSPPYGLDFTPSGGQPTGRFTNGRTIADILGESLNAKSFPPPYLRPDAAASAFDVGINYASGASGILNATGTLFIGRVPLSVQISNFEKTREYMLNSVGENRSKSVLKEAIFSLTVGSNDILNYFQPPFLNANFSPTAFQDFMVSNFTMHLKRLHQLGARKMVVVGVGPLGCIPFVRAINLITADGECSEKVNALVRGYNQKLKEKLHQLNLEMGPNAVFVYANSYDIFTDLILNYRNHGFVNRDGACCGGYVAPLLCTSNSEVCRDRKTYLFWDAYHPTEAANLIIAHKLLNGDATICSPFNISHLYTLHLH